MMNTFKPKHVQDQIGAVIKMENCINEVRSFLEANKLSNNEDKTEFLLFGTPQQLAKVKFDQITVGSVNVKVINKARNLGVIFDKNMSMEQQVNKICSTCFYNIKNIAEIRKNISRENAKTVINALVTSHLDYGNALLYGIQARLINKLQIVQNASARVIEKLRKYDHITEVRKNLHWLPIKARIEHKLLTYVFQSKQDKSSKYLQALLKDKPKDRNLRSNNNNVLINPDINLTTYGNRAFRKSAPELWNPLPEDLKNVTSVPCFKKQLKTYLFKQYYK